MGTGDILITVSTVWMLAAITPGPNFFITVHTAIGESRRLSLFTVSGIVLGTMVWAVSGFLGVSIIFNTVPVLYHTLKIIGGLYLIYIGLNLLTKKKRTNTTCRNKKILTSSRSFRLGFYTNILNPKTAAFMTSLFASTIPQNPTLSLGVQCVSAICLVSALWYSLVAAIFSIQRAKDLYEKFKTVIERVAGTIFIIFGARLALSK